MITKDGWQAEINLQNNTSNSQIECLKVENKGSLLKQFEIKTKSSLI